MALAVDMQAKPNEPAWMAIARAELGVREVAGEADNARVVEYLKTTSLPSKLLHDETPWCSAFVNWVCMHARLDRTKLANARSWLTCGDPISRPRPGCIVIFSRDEAGPASGHVAFYLQRYVELKAGKAIEYAEVLGGNQGNSVSLAHYLSARVIGYRWPVALEPLTP